jgi:broad specificity phosphatase PhoE
VATIIVFQMHALSEDNERGVASGWAHSRLSERGRRLAEELGERPRSDGIAADFAWQEGWEYPVLNEHQMKWLRSRAPTYGI